MDVPANEHNTYLPLVGHLAPETISNSYGRRITTMKDCLHRTSVFVGLSLCLALLAGLSTISAVSSESADGEVVIAVRPESTQVDVDDIFTLDIEIEAGGQQVDGASAYLDFDPVFLEVVDESGNPTTQIIAGATLEDVFINTVNNSEGQVDYSAGAPLIGTPPSGTFTLATIRFRAKAQTGGTSVVFVFNPPLRDTIIAYQGISVLGAHVNGDVTISAATGTPTPTPTPTSRPTNTPNRDSKSDSDLGGGP